MAAQTFMQALIGVGAYDLSAVSGEVQMSPRKVVTKEVPNFAGGGFMHRAVGVREAAFKVAGWTDFAAGKVGQQFTDAQLGSQQLAYVAVPGTTAGDPAEFVRGSVTSLSMWGGKIGDASPFTLEIEPDAAAVTGTLMAPLAARTTTGSGTAVAVTGPTATQRVYAALHVTAASGTSPTLAAKIQSAPTAGFASPTDRVTFTTATVAGWQYASIPVAAITDGWWRVVWTIGGTGSPSFTFAALAGVAP